MRCARLSAESVLMVSMPTMLSTRLALLRAEPCITFMTMGRKRFWAR
jgi:hypothetical protein